MDMSRRAFSTFDPESVEPVPALAQMEERVVGRIVTANSSGDDGLEIEAHFFVAPSGKVCSVSFCETADYLEGDERAALHRLRMLALAGSHGPRALASAFSGEETHASALSTDLLLGWEMAQ